MNDQVTASTRLRAASARLALRVRTWIGVSTGLRGASPRSNGVGGTRSTPRMRTISSTMSALFRTSARHDGTATFTRSPWPATKKPRRSSMRRISGKGTASPARRFNSDNGKSMTRLGRVRAPRNDCLRRPAAAQIEHHFCRQLEPGKHESRIDTALEPVAGVGIDAELAAGLGDIDLVPQRQLDEHVGRCFRAAGLFPAHDAGEQFHALLVGNNAHRSHRACRSCRRARAAFRRRAPRRTVRLPRTLAASNTCNGRPRSKVIKFVISTSALIGRSPIAISRFCSQSGDGPFFTPRTRRSAKAGTKLAALRSLPLRGRETRL